MIGDDGEINNRMLKHIVKGDVKMYIVHDDEIHVINVNGEEHDQDVLLDYVGEWIKEKVIKNIMKKRVKVYFVKDNEIYGVKIK